VDHEVEHHIHESPLSMTSVLAALAVLSAVGGFFSIPHFLEPQLALPPVPESLHHYETTLVAIAVAIGLAGLAGAAYVFGGTGDRAERLRERFAGVHKVLYDKYYVDELYDAVIARPLYWISDRVFLRLGDRTLIDGTLNGMAAVAQRTAGLLGRVQTGSLHFYAFLVLAGMVAVVIWSWRHV
jgi:NADH-quinone oxidoreductase subunit L